MKKTLFAILGSVCLFFTLFLLTACNKQDDEESSQSEEDQPKKNQLLVDYVKTPLDKARAGAKRVEQADEETEDQVRELDGETTEEEED